MPSRQGLANKGTTEVSPTPPVVQDAVALLWLTCHLFVVSY
jgi:hypothetical protein